MVMTSASPSKSTMADTTEIIQFLRDGENAIRISESSDIVLLLGLTGSGKTTLAQWLTGNDEHLIAVEQGVETGEFIIQDLNEKVCNASATVDSCTTIPDLIVDKKTGTPFYDNPGFGDTRHVKNDISVSYFIKKVIDSADAVKLIFVVNYPSVRKGVDRKNFMLLLRNAINFIKDVEKFKESIALVVTKVDNQVIMKKGVPVLVPDESIISNVAAFLEDVKRNLASKIAQPFSSNSEKYFFMNAIKFVDILLYKKGNYFSRIGLFRRPVEAGPLNESTMMAEAKKKLERMIHENLGFTFCNSYDFGYTVSAESINRIYAIVDQVNRGINYDVSKIAKEIEEQFLLQERDLYDVDNLYKKFHFGLESLQNVTKLEPSADPRTLVTGILQTLNALNIGVSRKNVDSILHSDKFLKFVRSISEINTDKHLEWVQGLTDVVQSIENSQKWYYFLMNLRTTLLKHQIQKEISRNSTAVDSLRNEIEGFEGDAEPIKEKMKVLLFQLYKDDATKEFDNVKHVKFNSWKLKFLMDMLDFQTHAHCQNKKLSVIGNYVHLSDVNGKKCPEAKFIEIFALSKVFIDTDFDRTGSKMQMSIFAPTWDVIGSPKISLNGERGQDRIQQKASDGFYPGEDGSDGLPGLPGGAGGNFLGFGLHCDNCKFLTISVQGGKGGRGQDGGNGKDGEIGAKPVKPRSSTNQFNIGIVRVSHEEKARTSEAGGNGGKGGAGGAGGHGGTVSISLFDAPETNFPSIKTEDGELGSPGNGGNGGKGGENEHVVESKTYLLGFEAWSNGILSRWWFSSPDGQNNRNLNYAGMEDPEPRVVLIDPAHPLNHYKGYLRENRNQTLSGLALMEFLNHLDTSEEVKELYDTLGLVDDLQTLESQYYKLHRYIPLLPFYESLLDKISYFGLNAPYSEISGECKKVLAFLYMSTLSKICLIDETSNNGLVIKVKEYLGLIVKDVEQLLKDFMTSKQRNDRRAAFQNAIHGRIKEAHDFIKSGISQEARAITEELDSKISELVAETHFLQNVTRNEQKKFNEHMITRGISRIVKLAGGALDFMGLLGIATEGFIEGTNLISESFAFDDKFSDEIPQLLPTAARNFADSISGYLKEKINLFGFQLSEVDKILRKSGNSTSLEKARSSVAELHDNVREDFEILDPDVVDVDKERNWLLDFLKEEKKSLVEAMKEDENVLERAEAVLRLPEGVYYTLMENKVNDLSSGVLDVNDKLLRLEAYENKIYHIILPLCRNVKEHITKLYELKNQSHANLDMSKWKIQNALTDIKTQLLLMTEGFQVQGTLASTIDKLMFGISTLIQVYGRIQEFRDHAELADYIADLASNSAQSVQVTNRRLSDAIDSLQVIMKSNLILTEYERAMTAFRHDVFPFAREYLAEFDLPASLGAQNVTEDILSKAIFQIGNIQRKLIENEVTINRNVDDHVFPDTVFALGHQQGPFYLWKYENVAREISQLFQGKEVILHADVTGSSKNAVKFNEIGIHFKFSNKASQLDFDSLAEHFNLQMTHFGMSYYRCANKFFVMMHDSQKMQHSVNVDEFGGYSNFNSVYKKLAQNKPMLSPYTMWKVKLVNASAGFEALAKFRNDVIDLVLEGRGMYVDRTIDYTVCNDHLEVYYKVDGTVSEMPAIEYEVYGNETFDSDVIDVRSMPSIEYRTIENLVEDDVRARRRRSLEDVEGLENDDHLQRLGTYTRVASNVVNPFKRFVWWLTGRGEEVPETFDEPHQREVDGFSNYVPYSAESMLEDKYGILNAPSVDQEPQELTGNIDSNGPQNSIEQVNYNLLNTQSNLLLLDLLARLKTGSKRDISDRKFVQDTTHEDFAHNLAYRAYSPAADE